MELQLAAKLGVSRTPIREAIRMLEQEGLAITIPRKGAEVARMTEKDMEDVLQIRAVLEERDRDERDQREYGDCRNEAVDAVDLEKDGDLAALGGRGCFVAAHGAPSGRVHWHHRTLSQGM